MSLWGGASRSNPGQGKVILRRTTELLTLRYQREILTQKEDCLRISPLTFMERIETVHPHTGHCLGTTLSRQEVIQQQAWCRSTNVFVLNHQGQVLCHQRSFQKERLPGVWVTHVGGHVSEGETYETNALKELEEEASIIAHPSQLITWRTIPVEHTSRVRDVRLWMRDYVVLYDAPLSSLVPQKTEVEQFSWKSIEEILDAERRYPKQWNAGIHNFAIEYYCLRAALIAAHAGGILTLPEELHVWRSGMATA